MTSSLSELDRLDTQIGGGPIHAVHALNTHHVPPFAKDLG